MVIFINHFLYKFYNIDNFILIEKNYEFIKISFNNDIYYLYLIDDISFIREQFNNCKSLSYFNCFIYNTFNSLYCEYNGSLYVLLKQSHCKFNLNNLYNGNLLFNNYSSTFDWYFLWCKKINNIVSFYKTKSNRIDNYILSSIDYYIGLGEMAISLLGTLKPFISKLSISYINYDISLFSNPLNTKIDIAERNFAEYLRIIFYSGEYLNIDFSNLFSKYCNMYNFSLVLIRLIFPHNYFYLIEKLYYFNENVNDDIKKIINKVDDFEKYIKFLYLEMKKFQIFEINI